MDHGPYAKTTSLEMVDEELERYRPWLDPVECPQKLLSGRDHPFVAVDT